MKKFSSHKHLFGLLFSRNAKKIQIDQGIIQTLSLSKKKHPTAFKVELQKKSFPSVYIINTTCFDECGLFHLITGRHYFYANLSIPSGLVQPPCCCVL